MYLVLLILLCFLNDTAPTEIYTYLHTLSLHDALPILLDDEGRQKHLEGIPMRRMGDAEQDVGALVVFLAGPRSEEHTSELQSLMRISYAVFCLKKKTQKRPYHMLN